MSESTPTVGLPSGMVTLTCLVYPGILVTVVTLGWGLQCPPCERIHCDPREASRLQCQGGVTTGVCGCCPSCARVLGEKCGGDFNYLGKCDRDLYCQIQDPGKFTDRQPEGSCVKGKTLVRVSVIMFFPPDLIRFSLLFITNYQILNNKIG